MRRESPARSTPADIALIETIAKAIVVRRNDRASHSVSGIEPAVEFPGEPVPLFLEPIVRAFIKGDQYRRVAVLMEDRETWNDCSSPSSLRSRWRKRSKSSRRRIRRKDQPRE
jgi:hypothetical protein